MKKSLFTLALFAISFIASAQQIHCNMVEMPLDQMLDRSTNIVECLVLNTESYWDEKRQSIYTRSEVQVLQNFKGDESFEFIQIITEGGEVENIAMNFSDKINMRENLHLILFLEPTPRHWYDPTGYGLSPVASLQSVFYVEEDGSMFDTFKRFKSIDQFKMLFGASPDTNPNPQLDPAPNPNALISITSFSPTTISAGTKSILTINGSGFGNVRGNGVVKFSVAQGTARETALAGDYVSWTDTQIQVFVPSRTLENISNSNQSAATGKIEVINNSGESFLSSTNLNIPFSILNNFAPGNSTSPSVINIGSNSASDGFDFSFSSNITSFAGIPAIKRAMETWICNTQVNWGFTNVVSNATNTGADNVNVIVLDSSNPLPTGVIARGVNLVTNNCFGDGFTPVSLEVDMIISANAAGFSYNFSTGNPSGQQIDLETVILHEFGHLLTLSHVSPSASGNQVMRASVNLGFSLRTPHPNDLAGAEFALDRAETFSFCGATGMQRLSEETPTISISSPDNIEDCLFNLSPITAVVTNAWSTDQIKWYIIMGYC
ncbi:MAG: IPT/TIG domain-containing protein [Flavobacteriales bacterium]